MTTSPCTIAPALTPSGHTPMRLVLRENLTIYNASSIKEQFLTALHGASQGLELDLGQVQEIDTAGVQLVLMLQRECQRLGRYAGIVSASQVVREALTFCRINTEHSPHNSQR